MKPRLLFLACALALAAATGARAVEARFSQAIAIGERAEIGFNRLTSDQVAALDALVRRDLARQSSSRSNEPAPAPRFSQRLTADERAVAGLPVFNEKELAQLDTFIANYATASLARTLLAPPAFYPTGMRLRPLEPTQARSGPEIHGSFTLAYGFGKGGYSEKSGGMTLNYENPAHNLAISFSYTESHIKGPAGPYRDGYLVDPPFIP